MGWMRTHTLVVEVLHVVQCSFPIPPPSDSHPPLTTGQCVFKVGATYMAPNGARANMKLGSRHWLIEHNWVNWKGGYCAKSYP